MCFVGISEQTATLPCTIYILVLYNWGGDHLLQCTELLHKTGRFHHQRNKFWILQCPGTWHYLHFGPSTK